MEVKFNRTGKKDFKVVQFGRESHMTSSQDECRGTNKKFLLTELVCEENPSFPSLFEYNFMTK